MALIDLFLSRAVRKGRLSLTHHDGKVREFGAPEPGYPDVAIRFTDSRVAGQIVRNPALAAGESFMDGRLVVEKGDVRDLVELLTANDKWEAGRANLNPSWLVRAGGAVKHRIDRINMERRSKKNVAHHYDLSGTLYELFLDTDKQYSCAYYTDPKNDLERAQRDKKAHIAAKLAIEPGMRVLDIGCGWGGMALYLHQMCGAEVLGVTLSEEQLKVARQRAEALGVSDKVKFELIDYRRVRPEDFGGKFDRIVSVGMFEHVGPAHYRTFFRQCRNLLTPEGVMLLHTIGRAGGPGTTDAFTAKYIFPGGYIPALSEIAKGHEGLRMFLTDVEVLRLHYAYTLEAWYKRVVAAKDAIVALYDERFYRMWTYYLAGSEVSFRHGGLVNYQLQYARDRHALPLTRDYMLEGERALREVPEPQPVA